MRFIEKFRDQLAMSILQRAQHRLRRGGSPGTATDAELARLAGLLPSLGPDELDVEMARRIRWASRLVAAGASEEVVDIAAKVAASGTVTVESLRQLENRGVTIPWGAL